MKFINLIGDVHGNIIPYLNMLERRGEGLPSIQLGDMGVGFSGVNLPTRKIDKFLRGNHDDPAACRKHPNYLGEFGVTEDGIFFISGAFSIDYMSRIPGVSWWEEEQLSEAQWDELKTLYEKTKPEFVVSHECPATVNHALLERFAITTQNGYYDWKKDCAQSSTCAHMQELLAIHQPNRWAFGHYHVPWFKQVGNTKFFCIGEMLIRKFEL
jgi:hypothetical protein